MNDRYNNLLNHDRWNRRLMNVYWLCNVIILVVELLLMLVHFSRLEPQYTVSDYFLSFVFLPSFLIFLITAASDVMVRLLNNKYNTLLPYVISFTCVALCAVLLIVHYNVLGIYVVYVMPVFFSLVYGNKRVLLFTFLSSTSAFIFIYFGYLGRFSVLTRTDARLLYDVADALTNIAMLIAAYFVGRIILSRFGEILDTVLDAERSAARAEAEAESRSLFLANMSHEIRTPMNGVIGFTELALDNPSLQPDTRDCLDNIKVSAEGLLGIIDGILDLSKIQAGKMNLEKVPFNLGDVVRQCRIISALGVAEKALELRFCADAITETLLGDPTRLRQALLNLLSNAVKFTDKGTVEFIAVADKDDGFMTIHFEVRDSGIGMTEEQLKKIFDPFVQADDSTTRKYGGTGLGLSITNDIVQMMGGELKAESEPGFGSKFSFNLRFEIAQQSDSVADEEKDSSETKEISAFEGNILVCEDNEMNQQVIRMHLAKFGLVPVIAQNGKIGLEKFMKCLEKGQSFDLIFMDIHMPVMDGLETSRKLLAAGCTAPIIALTANAMAEDRSEYAKSGMIGCLVKPFVSAELYLCLKHYLKAAGTRPLPARKPESDIRHSAEQINTIDKTLGLESCAGSEKLYQKISAEFLENGADWNKTIMGLIAANETDSAHLAAHTLSGRAAMLGAFKLSQAAKAIEYALAKGGGKSMPELESLLSALERETAAVLNELKESRKDKASVDNN